jgi:hypothetical protein
MERIRFDVMLAVVSALCGCPACTDSNSAPVRLPRHFGGSRDGGTASPLDVVLPPRMERLVARGFLNAWRPYTPAIKAMWS